MCGIALSCLHNYEKPPVVDIPFSDRECEIAIASECTELVRTLHIGIKDIRYLEETVGRTVREFEKLFPNSGRDIFGGEGGARGIGTPEETHTLITGIKENLCSAHLKWEILYSKQTPHGRKTFDRVNYDYEGYVTRRETYVSIFEGEEQADVGGRMPPKGMTQKELMQKEFEVALRGLTLVEREVSAIRNLCDEGKREFAKLQPRRPG